MGLYKYIGAARNEKPREVLITREQYEQMKDSLGI